MDCYTCQYMYGKDSWLIGKVSRLISKVSQLFDAEIYNYSTW